MGKTKSPAKLKNMSFNTVRVCSATFHLYLIIVVVKVFLVAGCEHSTGAVFKYALIPTKEDNPDKLFYNSTQERVIVDGRAVHHAPPESRKILETYPFRTDSFCIRGMVIYGPRPPAAGHSRLITKGERNMFYDALQTKLIVCSV